MYAYSNHFSVHLKLTQQCISTTVQYKTKIFKNELREVKQFAQGYRTRRRDDIQGQVCLIPSFHPVSLSTHPGQMTYPFSELCLRREMSEDGMVPVGGRSGKQKGLKGAETWCGCRSSLPG